MSRIQLRHHRNFAMRFIQATLFLTLFMLSSVPAYSETPPAKSTEITTPLPDWVKQKIAAYEANPERPEAIEIWQMKYKGQDAYLFIANCCDQYNPLYDNSGKIICAPSGGFSGQGNGLCSDALHASPERVRIWSARPYSSTAKPAK